MKDEEEKRNDNQIKEAEIKKEEMMRLREEKREHLKNQMDHFSEIYWVTKKEKERK